MAWPVSSGGGRTWASRWGVEAGRLRFSMWVPARVPASRVARVVEAARPGAVTEVLPATDPLPGGEGIAAGELHLAQPEWLSLRADQPTDPYRLLLATLCDLGSGGAGVVQVLARPPGRDQAVPAMPEAAVALRSGRLLHHYQRLWRSYPPVAARRAVA